MPCYCKHKSNFSLFSLLSPKLVMFLNKNSRDEILRDLTDLANSAGFLESKEEFFQALVARENIMSTGIGMGIAIPHGKLNSCSSFFIVIGIHSQGILWDAIDGALVRLVFLIGGPDNAQSEYLQLLSSLTLSLKDEARRQKLLQVQTIEEVMNVFLGI
ncbi:PTS system mannose-specific EIIBCA component [Chlamydia avium]|uniref:Phosphoenolpyruvate-dependent sugar phosphotransferase system, EIIA 2 family protein n=1 Tax=Chlamydia avium TaxID=1457141 RepID=A0ABN0MRW0_9CHLA|nr:PTS sugar transporter subunit IIA [Chlamydia avium]EPP35975.1 phosphoenolpyruvate-dependent sugar phosphotransferase system, EIIA 2 family protein [Chlamydia psittaci 10_743_SC13]EPP38241.1 phosphoenolpyruvate-dependent sugar phosphotransferase system, EIIA 2 family protein [Chlamydia avium]VVT42643.1 PTS system mannose-specific EIIBCA component [Chlamydia avium]